MIGLPSLKQKTKTDPPLITGGEHQQIEYYQNFLGLKAERPKYPSLQNKRIIYAKLDDELANQVIEVLEGTDWNYTELTTLIFRLHFYMNRVGLFTFFNKIHAEKLLDSDKPEDLIYIRDNLKKVVPDLMMITAKTVNAFRRGSK